MYFASTYRNSVSTVKFDSSYAEVTHEEYLWLVVKKGFKALNWPVMYNLSFTYNSGFITSFVVFDFESMCDAIDSRKKDIKLKSWSCLFVINWH